jgi:hypothetical protein
MYRTSSLTQRWSPTSGTRSWRGCDRECMGSHAQHILVATPRFCVCARSNLRELRTDPSSLYEKRGASFARSPGSWR